MTDGPSPFLRTGLPTAASFTISDAPARVKLDQNESPAGLPPELLHDLLDELRAVPWNRYPQPTEYAQAKRKMADAVGIDPDWLALTAGCDQAIQGAHWLAGGPGRRALVFDPTYPMLAHAAYLSGTKMTRVNAGPDYVIDPCLFPGHHLILLARPNNPTGHLVPETVVHAALHSGAMVFLDEAYFDFSSSTLLPLLPSTPNLLIGRSCSKSMIAGMRLGYLLGWPEAVARLERMLTAPYHLSQAQLIIARRFSELVPYVQQNAARVRENRERLLATLHRLGISTYPSAGNFLMFQVADPDTTHAKLAAASVRIRNLTQLPGLTRHLRVTIGNPEDNEAFVAALMGALHGS